MIGTKELRVRNMLRITTVILAIVLIFFTDYTWSGEFLVYGALPESYKKLDVEIYESSFKTDSYTSLYLPAIQFYYGLFPDFDIELFVNYDFYTPRTSGSHSANGIGDTIISATYCFLHESTYLPVASFEPSYLIPTGDFNAGLGNGKPTLTLPIYAQKNWRRWEFAAGIGYYYNTAPLTLNYFFGGARVCYKPTDKLRVGIEWYRQGASSNTITIPITTNTESINEIFALGKYTLLNAGFDYQLTKQLFLEASLGDTIDGSNVFITFLGFAYTFG